MTSQMLGQKRKRKACAQLIRDQDPLSTFPVPQITMCTVVFVFVTVRGKCALYEYADADA